MFPSLTPGKNEPRTNADPLVGQALSKWGAGCIDGKGQCQVSGSYRTTGPVDGVVWDTWGLTLRVGP